MRLLTQLVRYLAGKRTTTVTASEFSSALFPDLLNTQTLRLVTTMEFCTFGREELGRSLGISDRNTTMDFRDLPPSCFFNGPFWFELLDATFVENMPPGSALYSTGGTRARIVGRDRDGSLRSMPVDLEGKEGMSHYLWFLEEMVGALFALNELPPVAREESKNELRIPPALRETPAQSTALFNTIYLRRSFSNELAKAKGGGNSTLDIQGRRFHFVRGHWMTPRNKTERVWRRFHWRGDAELGVVRHVHKGG